jgi:hypothetical protein
VLCDLAGREGLGRALGSLRPPVIHAQLGAAPARLPRQSAELARPAHAPRSSLSSALPIWREAFAQVVT